MIERENLIEPETKSRCRWGVLEFCPWRWTETSRLGVDLNPDLVSPIQREDQLSIIVIAVVADPCPKPIEKSVEKNSQKHRNQERLRGRDRFSGFRRRFETPSREWSRGRNCFSSFRRKSEKSSKERVRSGEKIPDRESHRSNSKERAIERKRGICPVRTGRTRTKLNSSRNPRLPAFNLRSLLMRENPNLRLARRRNAGDRGGSFLW